MRKGKRADVHVQIWPILLSRRWDEYGLKQVLIYPTARYLVVGWIVDNSSRGHVNNIYSPSNYKLTEVQF